MPEGPVHVHCQSRALWEIVVELLRASNNLHRQPGFPGNRLARLGGPVSLEKSLQVAREILAAHGLAEMIQLEEGSGISRGNRFTVRGFAKLLGLFAPHANLLRGRDAGANKTSSLDDVRALAGYEDTARHGTVRFVIALRSNDGAIRFRLLRAIQSRRRGKRGTRASIASGRKF